VKRILLIGVASAASLFGVAAVAAPAMASNTPTAVTAVTHLNNHPDTTGVCNTGSIGADCVWALDNANEKFTVVPEGSQQYLVTMGYVGSFHGFADPRMNGELGGNGQGGALVSDGSVKGTIAYNVTSPVGPDPANLPGQSPSGATITDNISKLFDGQATNISFIPGSYTFTYHQVAGQDYIQVG
jgi:hypothetical protein